MAFYIDSARPNPEYKFRLYFQATTTIAGTSNMPISLGTTKVKCPGTQGALERGHELKEPTR
jgi:hypothetical protein